MGLPATVIDLLVSRTARRHEKTRPSADRFLRGAVAALEQRMGEGAGALFEERIDLRTTRRAPVIMMQVEHCAA